MKSKFLSEIPSALLILLFVYTAANKITDFGHFNTQLGLYPFIHYFAGLLAVFVIAAEIVLSLLLMIPEDLRLGRITIRHPRLKGLWGSLILLLVFTFYIALMVMLYKKALPCSCGGVISKMTWRQHIPFNLLFVLIAALGIRIEMLRQRISKNNLSNSSNYSGRIPKVERM